jgi:hypothetical protein
MNSPRSPIAVYVVVAAAIWTSIITAASIMLKGTPYVGEVLPMLLGGAVIFVILMPLFVLRPPTPRS